MTHWECLPALPCGHFNSHAHVERDEDINGLSLIWWWISTHTLTWSVTIDIWIFNNSIVKFQLTRSRGAWLVFVEYDYDTRISTHTLTWSVTIWAVGYGLVESISTHTLTWSVTGEINPQAHWINISTHTLTWSVTPVVKVEIQTKGISTHTLTWSVTLKIRQFSSFFTFQLTRSRGAWLFCLLSLAGRIISTHTLTWSVTICTFCALPCV